MRRQENQTLAPRTGYVPVPLFNQRRRNRIPLTSVPCDNDFFSNAGVAGMSTSPQGMTGTYGHPPAPAHSSGTGQSHQWNRQAMPSSAPSHPYGGGSGGSSSSRPNPGPVPTTKTYAPIAHPYKPGGPRSNMGQSDPDPFRKLESITNSNPVPGPYQSFHPGEGAQSKPKFNSGRSSQMSRSFPQKPSTPSPSPTPPYSQQARNYGLCSQTPDNSWNFNNSFETQATPPAALKKKPNHPGTPRQASTQQELSADKPAVQNSLRILTAVIRGIRHWSQFKDRVPYLFEMFATLDSAVTLGQFGAKNFLMRDGNEVLQCVYYENEQALPRLIRGQVHRCVGNYDRSRDVLVCVSVRPGLPSEQRNAQETVKVCDAEMRALVKTLSEV